MLTTIGELSKAHSWFTHQLKIGPSFSYHPEPKKCCLVVKESLYQQAKSLFKDLDIKITTSSQFLGGVVGNASGKASLISNKVQHWIDLVKSLSDIASSHLQSAYCAFMKSLQFEWTFLQCVTKDIDSFFTDLEASISDIFIPSLFGQDCSRTERFYFPFQSNWGV